MAADEDEEEVGVAVLAEEGAQEVAEAAEARVEEVPAEDGSSLLVRQQPRTCIIPGGRAVFRKVLTISFQLQKVYSRLNRKQSH